MKKADFDREKIEKKVLDAVVLLFNSRENENCDVSFVADAAGATAHCCVSYCMWTTSQSLCVFNERSFITSLVMFSQKDKRFGTCYATVLLMCDIKSFAH